MNAKVSDAIKRRKRQLKPNVKLEFVERQQAIAAGSLAAIFQLLSTIDLERVSILLSRYFNKTCRMDEAEHVFKIAVKFCLDD